MIIINSLDILWCINDVWVVSGIVIGWSSVTLNLIAQLLVVTSMMFLMALSLDECLSGWGGHNTEITC